VEHRYNPEIHHRCSIRLRDYDYSLAGAYFITICTKNRECLLGDVVDGEMRVNEYGRIVETCWNEIPLHFPDTEIDQFAIMPNHVHGIIFISNIVGATHASPLRNTSGPKSRSIGAIVGSFKSAVAKRINELRNTHGVPVWQRNYYDHIIRDEDNMNQIREYIINNPLKCAEDEENPLRG